jgi:hydrogenase/urease accessory protein HupE
LVVCVGLAAALLPRDGLILLPIGFSLMIVVGGTLTLDVAHISALRYFILGAALCMGLLVSITRDKLTVLTLLILASLGFHLGESFMHAVPSIATPMYFLMGVLLSLGMVLAIAVAFGMTLVGDNEAAWEAIKKSPRVSFIRNLFL